MTTTMHQLRRRRAFLNELSKFVGCTVWLTGLPSSGKTTLSKAVENVMLKDGVPCYVLDGDEVRKGLNSDLDFTEEGRHENIRRFAHVARLMADSGQVCIVSAIAPYEVDRVRAKEIHAEWEIPFIEVFVDCPLSVCTQRDVKGLYAWARKDSNIKLTGLSAPYEKPQNPDITIDTDKMDLDSCVHRIVENLYVKIGIKSENFTSTSGTSEDLVIDAVDLQWMQVLVEGWAAPLNTFMDENDYLQSLHFRSIERNGKRYSQSIPIILAIDDFDKQRLLYAQKINLIYNGKIRGILEKPTFYPFRKVEFCAKVFGITDRSHPSICRIMNKGSWLVGGGKLTISEDKIKWNDELDTYRLTAEQIKMEYRKREADCMYAFQLRNPLHNGHVLLIKETYRKLRNDGFKKPVLLLHPIGGWTKSDDIPLCTRLEQHKPVLKELRSEGIESILSIFPSPMLYAGPVEVQWHASARLNAGVTHYIVGRDPAGMCHPRTNTDLYESSHGSKLLMVTPYLGSLKIISFRVAAFNLLTRKMELYDKNKHDHYQFISGTKMRQMAKSGLEPPIGFMNQEAWKILRDFYVRQSFKES